MKKILFLTPDSFRQVNGGSVLFGELFNALKEHNISWFICTESFEKTVLKYKFRKMCYFDTPIFRFPFFNTVARRLAILGVPFFFLKYKFISTLCSRKAVRFAKKEQFDLIWVYAYHFAIPVAKTVHKKLKTPFHLSIQDDIYTHLPRYESSYLENDFKYLIENATSIDFISKEMGEYYKEKYNVKAKTITFLVSQQIEVSKPSLSQEIKKIGYAGNIWCGENFLILLEGLQDLDVKYSKLIKLYIYTNGITSSYFSQFEKYLVFAPFLEYDKLLTELQNCDLLYLPMTFIPKKRITNLTSFPSKLITYMNAQIPILNHSPEEAVSHKFVIENSIGYSITSMEKNAIVDFFINSSDATSLRQRNIYSENGKIALEKFDTKTMTDNFISLINN